MPVEGTRVQLLLPEGFEAIDTMSGFTNAQGDVILIQQFPVPMAEVLPPVGAETELFAKHGMQYIEREAFGGVDGSMLHVEQAHPLGTVEKWVRYFSVEGGTAMVMVSYNKGDTAAAKVLRAVAETARGGDAAASAPQPYSVQVGPPLKDVQMSGKARVFSESGRIGGPPSEAVVVAAPGIQPIRSIDRAMCVDKIRTTATVEAIEVDEESIVVTPTHCTVEATSKSAKTGEAIYLYQHLVRADDGRYLALLGRVGVDRRQALRPVFEASSKTLRWNSDK